MARLIGARYTPTTSSAGGIYTIDQAVKFKRDGLWPKMFAGRYWRLYITESHYGNPSVLFAELELIGTGGTDLTAGKTPTASNTYLPAANGIDDNNATYWQAFIDNVQSVLPAWFKVDLTASEYVLSYTLRADASTSAVMPKAWTLQVSDDDTNWTTAHTVSNAPAWSANEQRSYTIN